jgi:hypothetical protein
MHAFDSSSCSPSSFPPLLPDRQLAGRYYSVIIVIAITTVIDGAAQLLEVIHD